MEFDKVRGNAIFFVLLLAFTNTTSLEVILKGYFFMKKSNDWIFEHWYILLEIFVTIAICGFSNKLQTYFNSYTLFINVVSILLVIFFTLCATLRDSFYIYIIRIINTTTVMIFINQIYSYEALIKKFPKLQVLNDWQLVLIASIGMVLLYGFIFFVRLIKKRISNAYYEMPHSISNESEDIDVSGCKSSSNVHIGNKSIVYILGVAITVVILIVIAIIAYFKINTKPFVNADFVVDLPKFVSSLSNYSLTILLTILAIAIVALTIVELIRVIVIRITNFKNIQKKKSIEENDFFSVSIFIVLVMIVLAYKFSEFTINDLIDITTSGKYLAFPILVLIGIGTITILISLTQALLSLFMDKNKSADIRKQIAEIGKKLEEEIFEICKLVLKIGVNMIKSILELLEFIPDFFVSMKSFVFDVDNDYSDEADNRDIK